MKSTACCFCSGIVGSGRSGPLRPVLPCTCSAVTRSAHQRPDGAGEHLDVGSPGQFADLAGVLFGQRQRHVAGHRRDAEYVELRAAQGQQDGHRVVLARIRVDDDFAGFRHRVPRPRCSDLNLAAARTISASSGKMPSGFFPYRSLSGGRVNDAHGAFFEPACCLASMRWKKRWKSWPSRATATRPTISSALRGRRRPCRPAADYAGRGRLLRARSRGHHRREPAGRPRPAERRQREREFLHRGIAARQFQRIFVLADGMKVDGGRAEERPALDRSRSARARTAGTAHRHLGERLNRFRAGTKGSVAGWSVGRPAKGGNDD